MKLSDFDYELPKNLIAQEPAKPRDHSRLLVLKKENGKIEHKFFYEILEYLKPGDVLVLNNSKVMTARLIGKKKLSSGKIEIFLLHEIRNGIWQCLIGGRGAKVGLEVEFDGLGCEVIRDIGDGTWEVCFNQLGKNLMQIIEKIGSTPLPPYIKRCSTGNGVADAVDYQTVYADDEKIGSVAAPTAGLHFTPALMKKIMAKGVEIEYVTLHVGLGTFASVKIDDIGKHKMHSEWIEADKQTIARILKAKTEGKRVIAVGTTSARTLETIFSNITPTVSHISKECSKGDVMCETCGYSGWTDIFIYPGYKFKMVDALITNFHIPKSTLLMLVSALTGKETIMNAYKEAIEKEYRFYSYGDAMFIV